MPFQCPYCWQIRPDEEATKEHVVPKSLGGGLEPTNPLALEPVCRRCNSAAGRYIDRPYVRSWLASNLRAENQRTYLNVAKKPTIGLVYIGTMADLTWDGRICELWLGPTGDCVYHFHVPYPVEPARLSQVGGPVAQRDEEFDPGFVFLFIQATNPAWHETIILSVMGEFPDSVIHFGNSNVPPGSDRLRPIPQGLVELHERLRALGGAMHETQMSLDIHAGDRFLAKLALGLGSVFLGQPYAASPDAERIRNFMWGRTPEEREPFNLRGINFLGEHDKAMQDLLGWKPGHLLLLMPTATETGPLLGLHCNFYGQQGAYVEVATDEALWAGRVPRDGTAFIIAPGYRKWAGPVPAAAYALARLGSPNAPSDLRDLLRESENPPPLPPFHLPATPTAQP